ncbi:undecaprenyldiphospho-muramoylpentapeptide beta-N-acetylglucosaminyltransferase [Roseateles aquatilis]|uniref:UDP-N-acetylglucosamine--N-acetylmuramyl-(pentapeptide) pyrophosphoryl-undecaprenol N-acetylglucosamine transferase n=1 Tax=Roseateles aquatilis TaxID=431061 RepID=A0A246JMH1_9BURK|nr:undecaprenyldiphospho-muramoylpentapeptide beta-N-acetylglucosaminyltransferase [Roseateles aquatilis]OWQ93750.1 undecaprenyldiphospho-muramoylpentapeptide beta-N-acetylglucosaminyltransferase [Roseateles aquatilis]
MSTRHLVVMAAGTGGHVIPGLAVAAEMQRRGWTVSWLGTEAGMENKLVPPSGLPLDRLSFAGLRGKGLKHSLLGVVRLFRALAQSANVFAERKADAVLGMGGYVCFPGGLMAWVMRRPLMLVNADAALLLSNKALAPVAGKIAFGFDGLAAAQQRKSIVTGNPVRAEIEDLPAPELRFEGRTGPLKVLVVGGSLGARAINDVLPQALALWPEDQCPLVTHQTGEANFPLVQAAYANAGVQAEVVPFIHDMARRLSDADVVICRAGAVTVSELCAAGAASILVPLVVSTTSHQRDNAQYMAQHNAAVHLPQGELSAQKLFELLQQPREHWLAVASKARSLARPRAAARVADELEALVDRKAAKGARA